MWPARPRRLDLWGWRLFWRDGRMQLADWAYGPPPAPEGEIYFEFEDEGEEDALYFEFEELGVEGEEEEQTYYETDEDIY